MTSEQAIKTLAEVNMSFAIEEDPVFCSKKLVCYINHAGFHEARGIEDLP
jgi:hypothetical protein